MHRGWITDEMKDEHEMFGLRYRVNYEWPKDPKKASGHTTGLRRSHLQVVCRGFTDPKRSFHLENLDEEDIFLL